MNWKMAENSIFAILLRSPWWASLGVAACLIALASLLLPPQYVVFGWTAALPFVVIGAMVLWRLSQAPTRKQIDRTVARVRALNHKQFVAELQQAYRLSGGQVDSVSGAAADFTVTQGWRTRMISCRRWKAATVGVEPLRELHAAREAAEAHDGVVVALGELSPAARQFAREHRIEILDAQGLVLLLGTGARG